jgi:hypothetical protein
MEPFVTVSLFVVVYAVPIGIGLAVAARSPRHPAMAAGLNVLGTGAIVVLVLAAVSHLEWAVAVVPIFLMASVIAAVTAAISAHARGYPAAR